MRNTLPPSTKAEAVVEKAPSIACSVPHMGVWEAQICGPDGKIREIVYAYNKLTHAGCGYLWNRAFFTEANQPYAAVNTEASNGSGWFVGLIEAQSLWTGAGSGGVLNDDDSILNCLQGGSERWDDFANYDETTKPAYGTLTEIATAAASVTSAARSIANSTTVDISITAGTNVAVGGVYLINRSNATYSTTLDIIFSTAKFSTEPQVSSGDTIKLTYTHTLGASTS